MGPKMNAKAVAAREREETKRTESAAREAKAKEDAYWRDAEGPKSKAQLAKEDEARKKAEAAAKKAELKKLTEQEEAAMSGYGKKEPASAKKASAAKPKLTAAELARRAEEKRRKQEEEAKQLEKAKARVVEEDELDAVLLQENRNRDADAVDARNIDEALSALAVDSPELGDKHPEKRLKAAYKAFEEAELPALRKERPGLTLSQYKEQLWKLWKKSPSNPLNQKE